MKTSQRHRKPLLVIVSGAPGAGKTTLTRSLANQMRLVHLERDAFFHSLNFTAGETVDRATVGIPLFYTAVAYLLQTGASLIIDGTLYRGKSEQDFNRLQPYANLVNIHCRAKGTDKRFCQRHIQEEGSKPDWLEGHLPHLEAIRPLVSDPLVLGCTLIEVDTTGEYSPSLASIAKQLKSMVP